MRIRPWASSVVVLLSAALLGAALPASSAAAPQRCEVADRSAERVARGVILRFDSSFLCADAPRSGTYRFVVEVTNRSSSDQAVRLQSLRLANTTPKPRGDSPDATARSSDLPLTVRPGSTERFTVSGSYQLVRTDEGRKANLHMRVRGVTVDSAERFRLGVNAHLRAPGVAAE